MVDTYIDNSETQIYGSFTYERLRTIEGVDPIVTKIMMGLSSANDRMYQSMRMASSADGDIVLAVDERGPIGAEVVQVMNAFHDQLKAWIGLGMVRVAMSEFYVNGTKNGGGSTLNKRRESLRRILGALEKYDIPNKDEWTERFTDLYTRLTAVVNSTEGVKGSRKGITESLAVARDAWIRQYRATKRIIEGLLILEGREAEYTTFFRDLQVVSSGSSAATTTPQTPVENP